MSGSFKDENNGDMKNGDEIKKRTKVYERGRERERERT